MARIILGDRPPSYPSKATLAAELDVSESTVDDYVKRGILPKPIQLGGSVRWSWAQVQTSLGSMSNRGEAPVNDPFLAGARDATSS